MALSLVSSVSSYVSVGVSSIRQLTTNLLYDDDSKARQAAPLALAIFPRQECNKASTDSVPPAACRQARWRGGGSCHQIPVRLTNCAQALAAVRVEIVQLEESYTERSHWSRRADRTRQRDIRHLRQRAHRYASRIFNLRLLCTWLPFLIAHENKQRLRPR